MKDKQYKLIQENFKKFLYEENQVQVPAFLYHIVKAADEQMIKQQGLIANAGDSTDTEPGRIYFYETLPAATERYKKFLQTDPSYKGAVCFKIDTGKLEAVTFLRDYKNGGIYTTTDIPKEAIASIIRFGTTQMANEMAIAPQDVKVFASKNYNSSKLSKRLEYLIDEAIQYLNSGKKGKKPIGLLKSSVSGSSFLELRFLFDYDMVSADAELSQLLDVINPLVYIGDFNRKTIKKEESAWQKIKQILEDNYISVGWSDVRISLIGQSNKRQSGIMIKLQK